MKKQCNANKHGGTWKILLLVAVGVLNLWPIVPITNNRPFGSIWNSITTIYSGPTANDGGDQIAVPTIKYTTQRQNNQTEATNVNNKRPKNAPEWPKVAWLMSFPNSGTSYTGALVRSATHSASGTNYGAANIDEDGNSGPLFRWSPNGPFLTE